MTVLSRGTVPVLAALCLALGAVAAGAQGSGVAGPVVPAGVGGWPAISHWILVPWVTIALLVAGCLLLYHDLLTPQNWGLTGTGGVLCLGAVFAAQVTVGEVGWLGVVLLLLGLAAVLLEIHVLPGHGSALAGFGLLFAGMFLALGGTRSTAFALTTTTILTIVFGLAFLAYLPKSPAWKRIGAELQLNGVLPALPLEMTEQFVGHTGHSLTELRPNGMAEIEGMRIPVITEDEFLPAGTALVVTHQENGRVVVHRQDAAVAAVAAAIHSQAA